MDEEKDIINEVNNTSEPQEPVVSAPVSEPVVEPPVSEPVVEPPAGQQEQPRQSEPTPPKSSGNAGTIIAVIIIIALIAAIGVVAFLLFNKDDEDSDKKSSKKNETTNSAVVENETNTSNKVDKDKDEDEDEDEDEDVDITTKDGVKLLSDYSAFGFKIDFIEDALEEYMEDDSFAKSGRTYEADFKNNIQGVAETDSDGYVKSFKLLLDTDFTNEDDLFNFGLLYGVLTSKLGFKDYTDINLKIQNLASSIDTEAKVNENGSFPQTAFEKSFTDSHVKMSLKITMKTATTGTMTFELAPSK